MAIHFSLTCVLTLPEYNVVVSNCSIQFARERKRHGDEKFDIFRSFVFFVLLVKYSYFR